MDRWAVVSTGQRFRHGAHDRDYVQALDQGLHWWHHCLSSSSFRWELLGAVGIPFQKREQWRFESTLGNQSLRRG